jgi:hypothetical protein
MEYEYNPSVVKDLFILLRNGNLMSRNCSVRGVAGPNDRPLRNPD